ncbi:MAG: gamma-glutamylcyclotransferase family protein [Flavobacteriaceae bacterium]
MVPATEYLFTYGTLRDQIVQQELFSRALEGSKDSLPQHKVVEKSVGGLYPTIIHTGKAEDTVEGELYVISGSELRKTDLYEGKAYIREKLSLVSGIEAWVYRSRLSGSN